MIAKIRAAKPGQMVRDTDGKGKVPGLCLRYQLSGKKTWCLYYRTKAGRKRLMKLGDFEAIGLIDVREIARKHLLTVLNGGDPMVEQERVRGEPLICDLFEKCFEEHWSRPRFVESGWAREVKTIYKRAIEERFGKMRLSEVGLARVKDWHKKMIDTPVAANRALEVLSRIFNLAIDEGLTTFNPCSRVKAHTERQRERFAEPEEIKKIGSILEREFDCYPNEVAFLYLLMVTGARPRSIERARRDQLKFKEDYAVLSFSGKTTAETGANERLIIPVQGLELLTRIPIPRDGTLTGCKMPRRLWDKIRKEVGCPDLWARDLRRTFATVGLSQGIASGIIGEVQNHRSAETMKRYQKLLPTTAAEAVNEVAKALEDIIHEARTVSEEAVLQEGGLTERSEHTLECESESADLQAVPVCGMG